MNWRLAAALVLTFASIACGRPEQPSAPARPVLRTVTLPDIASASESAQTQIRQRYANLQQALTHADAPPHQLAVAFGDMGKLFIAAEFYDAAEICFDNARTIEPGEMKWPYYLGHVSRMKNDPMQAIQWFVRVHMLQPNHVPTLVWLAELDLESNRIDDAEQLLTMAESIEPGSAAVLYRRGRVALAKQDYSRAVQALEAALKSEPSATRVHYPLALAYRGLGNTRAAEAHLKQRGEVDLPPADPLMAEVAGLLQNAAAFESRGSEAIEARQWPEAVAALSKAIALSPGNALTRLNLGTALYMSGNAAGALDQYREAVRLSPGLARAHFGIGAVMEARGQDTEAIAAFTQAVASDPAYLEARFSLANALRRTGRVAESLPHYSEVLRGNPAVSQASFGYAMGLVRLGRYQEARDRLQEAVKAFPDQPGFAHALARLLAAAPDDRVRDGKRAESIVTGLIKIQRTAGVVETMAMTMAELGRFDEAVKWQREAMAMNAGGPSALLAHLGQNLRRYEQRQPCRVPWSEDDPVHHPRPE